MPAPINGGAMPFTKPFSIPRSVVGGAFSQLLSLMMDGLLDHVVAVLREHLVLLEVTVLSWLSLQGDLSGLSHVQKVLPNDHQPRDGQDVIVPSVVGGRLAASPS